MKLTLNPADFFFSPDRWLYLVEKLWFLIVVFGRSQYFLPEKGWGGRKSKRKENFPTSNRAEKQQDANEQLENE